MITQTITLTERARTEFAKLKLNADTFLRINVIPGGCSGMTYSAAADTDYAPADVTVFESPEVRIVTDEGSAIFLEGLKIDYSNDLIRSGFRFTNPNASGSCGCGSSFGG